MAILLLASAAVLNTSSGTGETYEHTKYIEYHSGNGSDNTYIVGYDGIASTEYNPEFWAGTFTALTAGEDGNVPASPSNWKGQAITVGLGTISITVYDDVTITVEDKTDPHYAVYTFAKNGEDANVSVSKTDETTTIEYTGGEGEHDISLNVSVDVRKVFSNWNYGDYKILPGDVINVQEVSGDKTRIANQTASDRAIVTANWITPAVYYNNAITITGSGSQTLDEQDLPTPYLILTTDGSNIVNMPNGSFTYEGISCTAPGTVSGATGYDNVFGHIYLMKNNGNTFKEYYFGSHNMVAGTYRSYDLENLTGFNWSNSENDSTAASIHLTGGVVIDNMDLRCGKDWGTGRHGDLKTHTGIFAQGHILIMGTGITNSLYNTTQWDVTYGKGAPNIYGGNESGNISTPTLVPELPDNLKNNRSMVYSDSEKSTTARLATFVIIHSGIYFNAYGGSFSGNIGAYNNNMSTYIVMKGGIVTDTLAGASVGSVIHGTSNASGGQITDKNRDSVNWNTLGGEDLNGSFVYITGGFLPGDNWTDEQSGGTSDGYYALRAKFKNMEQSALLGGGHRSALYGSSHVFIADKASTYDVQGAGRESTSYTGFAYVEVSGNAQVRHVLCGTLMNAIKDQKKVDLVGSVNIVITGGTVASAYGAGYDTYDNPNGRSMTQGRIDIDMSGGTVGNLYGGGFRGSIGTEDTDNLKIKITLSGGTILGSLYGGGSGGVEKVKHNPAGTGAGAGTPGDSTGYSYVYGSIDVIMTGGTVNGSVYGGGMSVPVLYSYKDGDFGANKKVSTGGYTNDGRPVASVYGNVSVTVTGGTVEKSVFGGGRGVTLKDSPENGDLTIWSGTVGSKEVKYYVENFTQTLLLDSNGDLIRVSWYDASNSDMNDPDKRDTYIQYRTSNSYLVVTDGKVTGGKYLDFAQVNGNTSVKIGDSATIKESVYGGGSNGKVSGNTLVEIVGGEVEQNVFGGGLGVQSVESVSGNRQVFINTPYEEVMGTPVFSIKGTVYGGSAYGDDGTQTAMDQGKKSNSTIVVRQGAIKYDVFGGGLLGKTYGDTHIYVGYTYDSNHVYSYDRAADSGDRKISIQSIYAGANIDVNSKPTKDQLFKTDLVMGDGDVVVFGNNLASKIGIRGSIMGSGNSVGTAGTTNVYLDSFQNSQMMEGLFRITNLTLIKCNLYLNGKSSQTPVLGETEKPVSIFKIDRFEMRWDSTILIGADIDDIGGYHSYNNVGGPTTVTTPSNRIIYTDGYTFYIRNENGYQGVEGYTLLNTQKQSDYGAYAMSGQFSTESGGGFTSIKEGAFHQCDYYNIGDSARYWYVSGVSKKVISMMMEYKGDNTSRPINMVESSTNMVKLDPDSDLKYVGGIFTSASADSEGKKYEFVRPNSSNAANQYGFLIGYTNSQSANNVIYADTQHYLDLGGLDVGEGSSGERWVSCSYFDPNNTSYDEVVKGSETSGARVTTAISPVELYANKGEPSYSIKFALVGNPENYTSYLGYLTLTIEETRDVVYTVKEMDGTTKTYRNTVVLNTTSVRVEMYVIGNASGGDTYTVPMMLEETESGTMEGTTDVIIAPGYMMSDVMFQSVAFHDTGVDTSGINVRIVGIGNSDGTTGWNIINNSTPTVTGPKTNLGINVGTLLGTMVATIEYRIDNIPSTFGTYTLGSATATEVPIVDTLYYGVSVGGTPLDTPNMTVCKIGGPSGRDVTFVDVSWASNAHDRLEFSLDTGELKKNDKLYMVVVLNEGGSTATLDITFASVPRVELGIDIVKQDGTKTSSKAYVALKEKAYYAVTYYNNGVPTTEFFPEGTILDDNTLKTVSPNFVGWYLDENYLHRYDYSIPLKSDLTLYARYSYAVTFDNMDGTSTVMYIPINNNGTVLDPSSVPKPTRLGYAFVGWYVDRMGAVPWDYDGDLVTDNTTLYAKWTGEEIWIKFKYTDEQDVTRWYGGNEGNDYRITLPDGTHEYPAVKIGSTFTIKDYLPSNSGYVLDLARSIVNENVDENNYVHWRILIDGNEYYIDKTSILTPDMVNWSDEGAGEGPKWTVVLEAVTSYVSIMVEMVSGTSDVSAHIVAPQSFLVYPDGVPADADKQPEKDSKGQDWYLGLYGKYEYHEDGHGSVYVRDTSTYRTQVNLDIEGIESNTYYEDKYGRVYTEETGGSLVAYYVFADVLGTYYLKDSDESIIYYGSKGAAIPLEIQPYGRMHRDNSDGLITSEDGWSTVYVEHEYMYYSGSYRYYNGEYWVACDDGKSGYAHSPSDVHMEDKYGNHYTATTAVAEPECIEGSEEYYSFSFTLNSAIRNGYIHTGWHNTHVLDDPLYPSSGMERTLKMFFHEDSDSDYLLVDIEILEADNGKGTIVQYNNIDYNYADVFGDAYRDNPERRAYGSFDDYLAIQDGSKKFPSLNYIHSYTLDDAPVATSADIHAYTGVPIVSSIDFTASYSGTKAESPIISVCKIGGPSGTTSTIAKSATWGTGNTVIVNLDNDKLSSGNILYLEISVDDSGSVIKLNLTMDDTKQKRYTVTYEALWRGETYRVDVTEHDSGTISVYRFDNGGWVLIEKEDYETYLGHLEYGDRLKISYNPNGVYQFSRWIISGECDIDDIYSSNTIIVVYGDCTVSANDIGEKTIDIMIYFDNGRLSQNDSSHVAVYVHKKNSNIYYEMVQLAGGRPMELYRGSLPLTTNGDTYEVCVRWYDDPANKHIANPDPASVVFEEYVLGEYTPFTVTTDSPQERIYYVISGRIMPSVYLGSSGGTVHTQVPEGYKLKRIDDGTMVDISVIQEHQDWLYISIWDTSENCVAKVDRYVGVNQISLQNASSTEYIKNNPNNGIPPVYLMMAEGYSYGTFEGFPVGDDFDLVLERNYYTGHTFEDTEEAARFDLNWTRVDKPADVIVKMKVYDEYPDYDLYLRYVYDGDIGDIVDGGSSPRHIVISETASVYPTIMGSIPADLEIGDTYDGKKIIGWYYDKDLTVPIAAGDSIDFTTAALLETERVWRSNEEGYSADTAFMTGVHYRIYAKLASSAEHATAKTMLKNLAGDGYDPYDAGETVYFELKEDKYEITYNLKAVAGFHIEKSADIPEVKVEAEKGGSTSEIASVRTLSEDGTKITISFLKSALDALKLEGYSLDSVYIYYDRDVVTLDVALKEYESFTYDISGTINPSSEVQSFSSVPILDSIQFDTGAFSGSALGNPKLDVCKVNGDDSTCASISWIAADRMELKIDRSVLEDGDVLYVEIGVVNSTDVIKMQLTMDIDSAYSAWKDWTIDGSHATLTAKTGQTVAIPTAVTYGQSTFVKWVAGDVDVAGPSYEYTVLATDPETVTVTSVYTQPTVKVTLNTTLGQYSNGYQTITLTVPYGYCLTLAESEPTSTGGDFDGYGWGEGVSYVRMTSDVSYNALYHIHTHPFKYIVDPGSRDAEVSVINYSANTILEEGEPYDFEHGTEITITVKPAIGKILDIDGTRAGHESMMGDPIKLSDGRGYTWSFFISEDIEDLVIKTTVESVNINFVVDGVLVTSGLDEFYVTDSESHTYTWGRNIPLYSTVTFGKYHDNLWYTDIGLSEECRKVGDVYTLFLKKDVTLYTTKDKFALYLHQDPALIGTDKDVGKKSLLTRSNNTVTIPDVSFVRSDGIFVGWGVLDENKKSVLTFLPGESIDVTGQNRMDLYAYYLEVSDNVRYSYDGNPHYQSVTDFTEINQAPVISSNTSDIQVDIRYSNVLNVSTEWSAWTDLPTTPSAYAITESGSQNTIYYCIKVSKKTVSPYVLAGTNGTSESVSMYSYIPPVTGIKFTTSFEGTAKDQPTVSVCKTGGPDGESAPGKVSSVAWSNKAAKEILITLSSTPAAGDVIYLEISVDNTSAVVKLWLEFNDYIVPSHYTMSVSPIDLYVFAPTKSKSYDGNELKVTTSDIVIFANTADGTVPASILSSITITLDTTHGYSDAITNVGKVRTHVIVNGTGFNLHNFDGILTVYDDESARYEYGGY